MTTFLYYCIVIQKNNNRLPLVVVDNNNNYDEICHLLLSLLTNNAYAVRDAATIASINKIIFILTILTKYVFF